MTRSYRMRRAGITKKILWVATVLVLAVTMVLATARDAQAAAVTIKTQDAANRIGGIRGIDVSKYQGNINWNEVARDDVNFVMIRASIGNETDETFIRNATGARAVGLDVGAYHYGKFTDYNSMIREAELFISQLRQVEITYPVVLDVEAHRNLSRSELSRLCVLFLEEIRSAGYDPMFYTYNNFFDQSLNIGSFSEYKLWVADYTKEPNRGQVMWQHTSYGSVLGISGRVDINIAYQELGHRKNVILVNAEVSHHIKQTLNDYYHAGLDVSILDMDEINRAIAQGLQMEVNRQFGIELPIYGSVSEAALMHLENISYVQGSTKGNITYLIQVKLFYKGLYDGFPTGEYDAATADSIRLYQSQHGLRGNGALNPETVRMLLG